jgi:hypothetical protein
MEYEAAWGAALSLCEAATGAGHFDPNSRRLAEALQPLIVALTLPSDKSELCIECYEVRRLLEMQDTACGRYTHSGICGAGGCTAPPQPLLSAK